MVFSRKTAVCLIGILLVTLPYWSGNQYYLHVASLIGVYWILIAGLNLVVGYTGQLSIGHVGLLAVGSYCYAILTHTYDVNPVFSILAASVAGAISGLALGLPALRLPGFYFAMVTMAFTMIVSEFASARSDITGGGIGLSVQPFPYPFADPNGFYWLVLMMGSAVTWFSWNIARQMWGRCLIAVRDSDVAAASVAIPIYRMKVTVFVFSGFVAGLAGSAFAVLQTYITPDTFSFDIGLFFFVAIIIGGRGVILGPLLGTAILTSIPELISSLAKYGTFFYGVVLLIIVLLLPDGVGPLLERMVERMWPRAVRREPIKPDIQLLSETLSQLYK
jgi:branched-chain amino acid transport system permease protein